MKQIEDKLNTNDFLKHFDLVHKIAKTEMKLAALRGRLSNRLNPINLSVLPKNLLERYKVIYSRLNEALGQSYRSFINSFGNNKNLINDIKKYEAVADVYEKYIQDRKVKVKAKKSEIFSVLTFIAWSGKKEKYTIPYSPVLSPKVFGFHHLTKKEILDVQKRYKSHY